MEMLEQGCSDPLAIVLDLTVIVHPQSGTLHIRTQHGILFLSSGVCQDSSYIIEHFLTKLATPAAFQVLLGSLYILICCHAIITYPAILDPPFRSSQSQYAPSQTRKSHAFWNAAAVRMEASYEPEAANDERFIFPERERLH